MTNETGYAYERVIPLHEQRNHQLTGVVRLGLLVRRSAYSGGG